jgi:hypothetical protein
VAQPERVTDILDLLERRLVAVVQHGRNLHAGGVGTNVNGS